MVRIHPDPPTHAGAVAQLGEHLLCKQGVVGSIPSSSTKSWAEVKRRMQKQALAFASGFLNQRYRLFFNNWEEVKVLLGRAGQGASFGLAGRVRLGWIVLSLCML